MPRAISVGKILGTVGDALAMVWRFVWRVVSWRRYIPALVLLAIVGAVVAAAWYGYGTIRGSLAQLDGEVNLAKLELPGPKAAVKIERDALGIPTIRAQSRDDLAFATGFLHGQERFFHIDLLRRAAAGEMSELLGAGLLDHDKQVRLHRFRDRAAQVVLGYNDGDRGIMENYVEGVNAGLKSLAAKPFEYYVLGLDPMIWKSQPVEPKPWTAEDTVLVLLAMYLDLQDHVRKEEAALGTMQAALPPEMFAFLAAQGTQWDAPIEGEPFETPPIPGPAVMNLRGDAAISAPPGDAPDQGSPDDLPPSVEEPAPAKAAAIVPPAPRRLARRAQSIRWESNMHRGSNNWAIDAKRSKHGGAILANDMHLDIRVPHIWYRARFIYSEAGKEVDISGVTLPGTPAMVVGSNGHVAWGFTNSEGDWVDLVTVEVDPDDPESYRTPAGKKKFEKHTEAIEVKGAAGETLEIDSTLWGPIVAHDARGRPLALRWVAHDKEAVNMKLLQMEKVSSLDEALRLAAECGSPAQNFTCADNRGQIGWTILGRIPRRVGYEGRLPTSWADGKNRWDGWLKPDEYPKITNPANGRIWTANARVVGGDKLAKLGFGSYDLGARAGQIRDDLLALDKADESDMLATQLDDRALFLAPWRELMLEALTDAAMAEVPYRRPMKKYVQDWGGRAAPDSVGFALVREFRQQVLPRVLRPLIAPCKKLDPKFDVPKVEMMEGAAWKLVHERPMHLLDPKYESWEDLYIDALDGVLAHVHEVKHTVDTFTWGSQNTARIKHPFSDVIPLAGALLDMPKDQFFGDDANIPRIQSPDGGASQRMAVSPGKEDKGYLHMPCGQSGHPLSPHYRAGHSDWVKGEPTPLLPGDTIHTLTLLPGK